MPLNLQSRHARACPEHPRLSFGARHADTKTWILGTSLDKPEDDDFFVGTHCAHAMMSGAAPGRKHAGVGEVPVRRWCSSRSRRRERVKPILLAALAGALLVAPAARGAEEYPSKPIRLVIPFPPGGPTDTYGRLIGHALEAAWGQPVIADNRPGATGTIGTALVVKAPPDGYTLLMAATSSHISPYLYQTQSYDPNEDLAPVINLVSTPFLLVGNPGFPAVAVGDLVSELKRRPGHYSYGSPGAGSGGHLVMEMFKRAAGVDAVHVPYKGSGPVIAALLAGEVPIGFDTVGNSTAHIAAGRLKPFALSGAARSAALPSVPTFKEAGYPDVETFIWFGVFAPKGTPAALIDRLNAKLTRAMQSPAMQQRLAEFAGEFAPHSPAAFRDFLIADTARWKQVIVATGVRAE
jgi:tripartite-type tricarboxylate transporter receptor subunit TctC